MLGNPLGASYLREMSLAFTLISFLVIQLEAGKQRQDEDTVAS